MAQRLTSGKATTGRAKKKIAVSYIIREKEEPLNKSGVNALRLDPAHHLLYSAGRDSIIRSWDVEKAQKKCIMVGHDSYMKMAW